MASTTIRSNPGIQNYEIPLYHVWNPQLHETGKGLELPELVSLIKEKKVNSDTWIYSGLNKAWNKASELKELSLFFKNRPKGRSGTPGSEAASLVDPALLRRIKIFAQLSDNVLEAFLRCMELLQISPFATVVHKGEHGDAMYFVLEGELRARIVIDGRETILSTLSAGDFFGEISLLDQGPRSADVVANEESTLLKLSAAALERIVEQAPEMASPVMFAICRSIVSRVRTVTKRYEDSIQFWRAGGADIPG